MKWPVLAHSPQTRFREGVKIFFMDMPPSNRRKKLKICVFFKNKFEIYMVVHNRKIFLTLVIFKEKNGSDGHVHLECVFLYAFPVHNNIIYNL